MIIWLCALMLTGPIRPDEMIGTEVMRYDIYRTDRTEHCFEEVRRLGRTRWQDQTFMREVPMEFCQEI